MLTGKKLFGKLLNIEKRYSELRYEIVVESDADMMETFEHYVVEPSGSDVEWKRVNKGRKWGGNRLTAWFRCDMVVPKNCNGKRIFIRAKTGAETLFLVDGEYKGVFDRNHSVVMMTNDGIGGQTVHLAFEAYSGHHIPGCGPDENERAPEKGCMQFDGIEMLLERTDVSGFVFDLMVLRQLVDALDENSLRRNKVIKGLERVFGIVDAMPADSTVEIWRPKLSVAREIMNDLLQKTNSVTTPYFGIIGHSHLDTAWLWTLAETRRKCARTFSSVLNLMEQYPEFVFIQSAPYHVKMIKESYPGIFNSIREQVERGLWEPNGAMWIEPDCNIPSGESLVRQLMRGQMATREMFGYTSDTLWLPDVFGYSAALPQILKGCGVEFFCTTKISWNDTTRFPYDTFVWKGIDGTGVISHFHFLECWPDPKTMTTQWNDIQHKDVQDRRLIAIGYGDGGGGPTAEMLEVACRVRDLEGCPRSGFQTVSSFMRGIRDELTELPEWNGELYLELHRGTLTSIAAIKRGNRKTEVALRNAEFVCTIAEMKNGRYPTERLKQIWEVLLVNQFHDILPGSSIAPVNDEAIAAFEDCIKKTAYIKEEALHVLCSDCETEDNALTILNSLNWNRTGEMIFYDVPEGLVPAGILSQCIVDMAGMSKLATFGLVIPALGGMTIPLIREEPEMKSAFHVNQNKIETPFASVVLDEDGRIISFTDKTTGRELVKPGGALNTIWLGEDVPGFWDNWDIDREQQLKMRMLEGVVIREIASDGPLQLRIRICRNIGSGSHMVQDMVFHATSPQVDFETVVEWHEKHQLLKAGFDLNVFAHSARHEIQYGHVERNVHENLLQDRAKFEVCMHKWVDISEAAFGVALLNDCKYGVSIKGGDIRISLIKSGMRPDPRGDEGRHAFTYSMLPHASGFSVESVIRPAYELNIPAITCLTGTDTGVITSLAEFDASNIIVESVKRAENGEGFILRFYDALKNGGEVNIRFRVPVHQVYETNLLEEKIRELKLVEQVIKLYVRPFEIKTILCI